MKKISFTLKNVNRYQARFYYFLSLVAFSLLFFSNKLFSQNTTFDWAKKFGSSYMDFVHSMELDASGNIYLTGSFAGSCDFDPSSTVYTLISNATTSDVYVVKLDASGNLIWAKCIGGTGADSGHAIKLDAFGNVYVTGQFAGTADFNPGSGTYNLSSGGGWDGFLLKLNSAGNFVWAQRTNGTGHDHPYAIELDASGNIFTTGRFFGTVDFDPGPNTSTLSASLYDIFITKSDPNGNLIWAQQAGGSGYEAGLSLTVDGMGNVCCTGTTNSIPAYFGSGSTAYSFSSNGGKDIFTTKLDPNGNFLWTTGIGGVSDDDVYSVTSDEVGNIYIGGSFGTTVDFDPGPGTHTLTASYYDMFITKLDPNGNFGWAKKVGGIYTDKCYSLKLDGYGFLYATGSFMEITDFDPGPLTFTVATQGNEDIFISKMDTAGNFVWAESFGGVSIDEGYNINIDALGNVYTTGVYKETVDFDHGVGVYTLSTTSINNNDVFIHKMSQPSVGMKEYELVNGVSIYPNPTSSTIHLQFKKEAPVSYEIRNALGHLIFAKEAKEKLIEIDLKDYQSGLYFVTVKSDGFIKTSKVIKE
ncbi:MAG: hypothetical protein K0S32_4356 [Bacteroidetes bacterium]|jgi:hypothetical protein|nr:hypothetical protein [Bacteroidota bacterium]